MDSTNQNIYNEERGKVLRNHKDRVFRMYFSDKVRLLSLYNALNETEYTNPDELEINTLENAIFMTMKNDISFILDSEMCLYEHQSTLCPNMPLRGLIYFASLYGKHVSVKELSGKKRVVVPTPKYVVFYNGKERKEAEFTQYLSDSFKRKEDACMEVSVRHINVNYDSKHDVLRRCPELNEYAFFVREVRKNAESLSIADAVNKAISDCIEQDIMKEFLIEHRAEVADMSIYEFNMEEFVKSTKEAGFEEGREEGRKEGRMDSAKRFVLSGMSPEQVAEILELDLELVKGL